MNKQDQMKVLMDQLHKKLLVFGYRKNNSRQHFWKPFEFGKVAIHVNFIDHIDDFDLTVDVGIRFDELEEMKNINNALLNQKEKKQTFSIGSELGNMSEGKQKRWTINEESNIEEISSDIYRTIEEVAFPYIDKYTNMENAFIDCLYDKADITGLDYVRARNAVGFVILLNRTKQIDQIIKDKFKCLKDKNDFGIDMFIRFVNGAHEISKFRGYLILGD